jgi:hypothetical protein
MVCIILVRLLAAAILAELFHAVGHEMVHVNHFVSKEMYKWLDDFEENKRKTMNYSDYLAWHWNYDHLCVLDYPGAKQEFIDRIQDYLKLVVEQTMN